MWLRSCAAAAVVQVASCTSNLTPGLRTSICHEFGPKKIKDQKKKRNLEEANLQRQIRGSKGWGGGGGGGGRAMQSYSLMVTELPSGIILSPV